MGLRGFGRLVVVEWGTANCRNKSTLEGSTGLIRIVRLAPGEIGNAGEEPNHAVAGSVKGSLFFSAFILTICKSCVGFGKARHLCKETLNFLESH